MKALRYLRNPGKLLLALDKRVPLLSDRLFLKLKFKDMMGYKLNLRHPKTFNEKIQWLKLHDRKPEYARMVDKIEAKKYVAEKIGEEYIIPTISTCDHFDEINLWQLPEQFVIKCSHDSGGLIVCRDRKDLDLAKARRKIETGLKKNFYYVSREWPYKSIKPRILIEECMTDDDREELTDYKFMCFGGEVKCIFTCTDRFSKDGLKVTFFDRDWNVLPFERKYPKSTVSIPKPPDLEKMIELSERLAKGMSFVRIDFYNPRPGVVKFGEITFYPGAGFEKFSPKEWDYRLGDLIKLPIE